MVQKIHQPPFYATQITDFTQEVSPTILQGILPQQLDPADIAKLSRAQAIEELVNAYTAGSMEKYIIIALARVQPINRHLRNNTHVAQKFTQSVLTSLNYKRNDTEIRLMLQKLETLTELTMGNPTPSPPETNLYIVVPATS